MNLFKGISAEIENWLDQSIASAEKKESDIARRRVEYLAMVQQHRAAKGVAIKPTAHPRRPDHSAT